MTWQNRVTPFGNLVAVPARGALTGNRGILHDAAGNLGAARWRHKVWIACLLRFRGRHRPVMQPGRYTHLFFLDEATALAAGHRPCFECRHRDATAFADAWMRGNRPGEAYPGIAVIDGVLQRDRVSRGRSKVTHAAGLAALPDGCFVTLPDDADVAWLLWRGRLHRWTAAGYGESLMAPDRMVTVLTPRCIVAALAAGYRPSVHASADPAVAAERRIAGFRQDVEGQWVADLDCGHSRHVRHQPPWQERAWVTSVAGRRTHLGSTLTCRRCAAGEPP
ncbi:MAG TPA: DUF3565 domain-containing protein [Candidatus Sulfotelmatobacter sp.]|nr:DUF3565 domain-containing protein [Candidatus Sulfotelmatobacter sp.]